MITPLQLRMARAALNLTLREASTRWGVSHTAIHRYERGDEAVFSLKTTRAIVEDLQSSGVYLGPRDGISIGENVFAQDRWWALAALQLLKEAGIQPDSRELIEAGARARHRAPIASWEGAGIPSAPIPTDAA